MAVDVRVALRSKRLRRHSAVKLVWLWIASSLSADVAAVVKVGATASALGLKRSTVRAALKLLVSLRYLHCTTPATAGTPGEYVLGARALRNPTWVPPTGPARAPARPLEELPLFRLAS